jgi:hypothetical protein
MTVVRKVPACWECVWFDGERRRSATFVEPDLAAEPVSEEPPILLGPEHEAGPWNRLPSPSTSTARATVRAPWRSVIGAD